MNHPTLEDINATIDGKDVNIVQEEISQQNADIANQLVIRGRKYYALRNAVKGWITEMDNMGYTDKQYGKGKLKQALIDSETLSFDGGNGLL